MNFTDEMTVTIKIHEPTGAPAKLSTFAYKLQELTNSLMSGPLNVVPSGGASNNDAGFLSFEIHPLNKQLVEAQTEAAELPNDPDFRIKD